jgi:hypothetical protein
MVQIQPKADAILLTVGQMQKGPGGAIRGAFSFADGAARRKCPRAAAHQFLA